MRNELTSVSGRAMAWVRQHKRASGVAVAVSALALIGVAVAIGWAIFASQPATAQASPSGEPSADPSVAESTAPTAAPASPPTIAPVNWPPPGDTLLPGLSSPSYWAVSAVNDLNIRAGAGTEHPVVGQLGAGDLVLVIAPAVAGGWFQIMAEGRVGFVNAGRAGEPYLRATPARWESYFASLTGVASDGSTYLAWGTVGELDYLPWEGYGNFLLLRSDDGRTWTRTERDVSGSIVAVAGGAGGWVRLTGAYPGVSLVSYSADGQGWEAPQQLDGTAVAYGPGGWVVIGGEGVRRSADGQSWSDAISIGADPSKPDQIEASDAGYVVFSRLLGGDQGPSAWASADGVVWTAVDFPSGAGWISDAELVGNRLLVLTTDSASGESALHHGRLGAPGSVTWEAPPGRVDVDGLRVDSISQGPDGLLALGWDSVDLVPVLWRSSDGASWQRLDSTADALGGSVGPEPAWGSAGWVALGTSADGAGTQLWRSADGASWEPTGDTVGYTTPVPPCPPPEKVSTLVLMYLGPLAERCLGDASLTIRGWVPKDWGFGGCCPPISEPGWLASFPNGIIFPAEFDEGMSVRDLPLHVPPGVDDSALYSSGWVAVVGHFYDKAAPSCTQRPQSDFPNRLGSLRATQRMCQQRFVVESITAVKGP